ncbi:MAG: hypothetical protein ACK4N5_19550, partial [Myxococcales bacterium]
MKLFFLVAAASALTGCTSTKRFVTSIYWNNADTVYVAYTEETKALFSTTFEAKVKKCSRQDNNALQCAEQTALNAELNKKE